MRWTAVPGLPLVPAVVVFAFVAQVAAVRATEAVVGGGAVHGGSRSGKSRRQFLSQPKERRPNIVLIMTDDQDIELGSLNFMPRTLRLLRDGGAQFRHAYTTTPMCCPSRSSMLTGMYMHNHEVYTNNGNCSSAQWQATHETRTFATYLSNAGYRTGYFGKYLNKYNGSYIPPGWREWGGLIMNSRYYNYSVNLNGKKIKHGDDYFKDYYPDLIANDSVAFLRQSKQYFSRKPVMLVLGFPAPHGPEDSAPQYSNLFFNVTSHHTPSYDYAPNPDKQWILQVTGQMQPIHRQFTDLLMTKRLQTLQSVDDAVDKVYQELKALGELDNTYIIYTSDHGYHLGQFGLVKGKSFPFEFDVRVPFLVRGPGIEPGTIIDELVLNIDLAPTFLDIAGVDSPGHMDGRSFLKLLNRRHKSRSRYPTKWPDTFLIESSGRRDLPDPAIEAKLKKDIDSIEKDLNQTLIHSFANVEEKQTNVIDNSTLPDNRKLGPALNESLPFEKTEEELNRLVPSKEGPGLELPPVTPDSLIDNQVLPVMATSLSKLERLAIECQRPEFQHPCKPGQKWQCIAEGTRWRKHKCKIRPVLYSPVRGKKCACFTSSGTMYTRFEPPEERLSKSFVRSRDFKSKYLKSSRAKRSSSAEVTAQNSPVDDEDATELKDEDMKTLASLYQGRDIVRAVDHVVDLVVNSTLVGSHRTKRSERESLDSHVSNIMGVLQHKINGLKISGNSTSLKMTADGNCTVGIMGEVSCSDVIYHDPKAWKASRNRLEEQIRRLKIQLERLKDIRKHLKEKRPSHPPYDHSLEEEDAFKLPEFDVNKEDSGDPSDLDHTEGSAIFSRPTNRHRHHHTGGFHFSSVPGSRDQENRGRHGTGRIDFGIHEAPIITKRPKQTFLPDTCYCEPDLPPNDEKELAKEARRRIKEERMKKKDRKLRKKAKMESECLSEKMNCFNHDNDHWKTPPFWTEGPFCFCMNANNNTYSCIRTINATHNFLYCEFVTGLKTYYNLRIDPFEQWNRFHTLTIDEKSYLHDQLDHLKKCKGMRDCTVGSAQAPLPTLNGNGRVSKKQKFLLSSGLYDKQTVNSDSGGDDMVTPSGNQRDESHKSHRPRTRRV